MTYEYVVAGNPVKLEVDKDMVGVRYSEPAPYSFRAMFSEKIGADFDTRLEIPNEKFTILKKSDLPESTAVEKFGTALNIEKLGISRMSPIFKIGDTHVLATDRILIGLRDVNEPISPLLSKINYKEIQARGYGEYTVTLSSDSDPLEIAEKLNSSGIFSYVEPDFVNVGYSPSHNNAILESYAQADDQLSQPVKATVPASQQTKHPNAGADKKIQHYGEQPATKNGQNGNTNDNTTTVSSLFFRPEQYAITRTKADQAWQFAVGDPSIRIAVLDEGVDTKHADLQEYICGAFDASDNDEFQEPNAWDGHGTACAGLAAAVPHDASGVRGVAFGCSILAVRIAYSERPHGPWATTNGQIASAIDWSWRNGASILSNSWGGGAPSNALINAFDRAKHYGREGKGCIIVVAAGNNQGPVSFPANIPDVICVAASNQNDEIKTKESSDGESWWGSNFGPEVTVAAPGVHNLTTDITGSSGYNVNGDYFSQFNGTSSATPLVAGACALILSANTMLSSNDVRNILRETAEKVGDIEYINGRNDHFGYGRVNILRAVQSAAALVTKHDLAATAVRPN